MSENQSYFSKQSEKQEFIFLKNVSQEKSKSNTQDLTTSNRFSVLAGENASVCNHPPYKNNCAPEKRQHYVKTRQYPTMVKNLINQIKIYQKGIAIAAEKSVVKRR